MNCKEIKDYALLLCGLGDIPNSYVLQYINEIMDSLVIKYDSAGKRKTTYIAGIENEWMDLPVDCMAIKRCFKEGNNYVCDEFLAENNQIQFKIQGEYKIEYIGMHERVVDISNTPNINIAYHEALAYGVAHKETTRIFMHEDMAQGNNKLMLLQEFNIKSAEANRKLSSAKRSRKRMQYADFF